MLNGSDFILMCVITTVLTILILVKSMLANTSGTTSSFFVRYNTFIGDIDPGVSFFLAIFSHCYRKLEGASMNDHVF